MILGHARFPFPNPLLSVLSPVNAPFNSLPQIIPEPGPPGLPGPMVGLWKAARAIGHRYRFVIACD